MPRSTIDFGIYLGSADSQIAVFNGTSSEVIKNNWNLENTPSAVWIDERGRKFVGAKAKERHEYDPDNAKIEFKRQMGSADPIFFAASGKKMLPEELSAEVLLLLKASVDKRLGEEIATAVISVPADFHAPQIEATNRAARLAGLETSPLVQEPVAAAMAYGFQEKGAADARWLVYDLGGGTFDAALIRKRDGMIRVENHGGDKLLGGKDIDWEIVHSILVPKLLTQARLANFTRNNPRWRGTFAKLKIQAEDAKIHLSGDTSAVIDVPDLCKDDSGRPVDFEIEIRRQDLEPLVEPFISRSISVCKQVLSEKRLAPSAIEKIVLVGGLTLIPYLRDRLKELGIPLEFSVDPFTVVARGAAMFAGTQPLRQRGPIEPRQIYGRGEVR